MKRLIAFTLMLTMLFSAACAKGAQEIIRDIVMNNDDGWDRVYAITPAEYNTDELKKFAFGDQAGEAVLEEREYGFQHYYLPGVNGVPFCGAGADHYLFHTMQSRLSIYRYKGEYHDEYQFDLSANVYPDGQLPEGMISAEEAEAIAAFVAPMLGLKDAHHLSTTAYGRLPGSVPGYKAIYLQRLNSRPIYWGAADATGDADTQPTTNLLEVVIAGADGELIRAQGEWSAFEPAGHPAQVISPEAAQEVFRSAGIDPQPMERCYWLTPDPGQRNAIPAYRAYNSFLNALTGEWLQLAP